MDTYYAYAVLIIGITFLILGLFVLKLYQNQRNVLSLYLIAFFLVGGCGWVFGLSHFAIFHASNIQHIATVSTCHQFSLPIHFVLVHCAGFPMAK